jgi:hypothetical protein
MSLYELNKDMLIKLIMTIQEDTSKELNEIIDFLISCPRNFKKCEMENCKALGISEKIVGVLLNDINLVPLRCNYIKQCDNCLKIYCDKHISKHNRDINLKYNNGNIEIVIGECKVFK